MKTKLFSGALVLSLSVVISANEALAQQRMFERNIDAALELIEYGIDTTNIELVKSTLMSSEKLDLSIEASYFLAERIPSEAIPLIRDRYDEAKDYGYFGFNYLGALYVAGDNEIVSLLHAFVDSVHAHHTDDPILYSPFWGIRAAQLLVNLDDFSKFQFVAETLPLQGPQEFIGADVIGAFASQGSSQVKQEAFDLLVELTLTHPSKYMRLSSLKQLELFSNQQMTFPTLLNVVANDSDAVIRTVAGEILLKNHKDRSETFQTFIDRINTSNDREEQISAVSWLAQLPYPSVLVELKRIEENHAVASIRELSKIALEMYLPPEPEATINALALLDSLISTKHQVASYHWVGDKNFVNELDNHLENARKHLVKGDSTNSAKEVEKFQEKVNKEYKKTIDDEKKNKPRDKRFVTVEGWKFLYYNAQYIIDRLPGKKK